MIKERRFESTRISLNKVKLVKLSLKYLQIKMLSSDPNLGVIPGVSLRQSIMLRELLIRYRLLNSSKVTQKI